MDIELIRDYLARFQNQKFEGIIERDLKIKYIKEKAISVIGPRRAGKTYFFFSQINMLKRDKTIYLDLEEPFLRGLDNKEILRVIFEVFPEITGTSASYIFMDEIQNLKGWESVIRSLLNRNLQVFITGSSSKLLSKEIATQLRGRTLSYLLFPFSFKEFLRAKHQEFRLDLLESRGKIKRMLSDYLNLGGFPEIVLKGERERIIKEYLDLAFFKDFVERHEIKSIHLARYLFNHMLQNFSTELSVRSVERKLRGMGTKFNITTLYKYVEDLEDTLFIFFLRKFSWKPHERETWPRKVYVCDTSLLEQFKIGKSSGRLMENVVFLELIRKTNEKPLLEIYYWKDYQGREVDFVVKEGQRIKELIQVTHAPGRDEIERREIKSLLKASRELGCKNLLVITWDYEGEENLEGRRIRFLPLWKWLIKENI